MSARKVTRPEMILSGTTLREAAFARRTFCVGTSASLAALLVRARRAGAATAGVHALQLMDATISDLQDALSSGNLTSQQLIEFYLRRIHAYNHEGPNLSCIITINSGALAEARRFDEQRKKSGARGPLFGVPVILKDNMDTAGIRTTGGTLAFKDFVPKRDSFVAHRVRQAGAIILAKGAMGELAFIPTSRSSVGGQPLNPYDLTRSALGSSGGPAIAVTSNLCAAALGTDTVDSIRGPAAVTDLVGLRPTKGLVSTAGIIPISHTQDEAGPLTRTVRDAAIMLDVIAGYDPADPITAGSIGHIPSTYTASLRSDGLKDKRIGVLRGLFRQKSSIVNKVINDALGQMQQHGAVIINFDLPTVSSFTIMKNLDVQIYEFQTDFNRYLASLGSNAPVKSMQQLLEMGEFSKKVKDFDIIGPFMWGAMEKNMGMPEYRDRLVKQGELRRFLEGVMASAKLDAFAYPAVDRMIPHLDQKLTMGWWNGEVAAVTGMPAMTVPAGFSPPSDTAPIGFPVGIELMARRWAEPTLFEIGYAFEQLTTNRRMPESVPALS